MKLWDENKVSAKLGCVSCSLIKCVPMPTQWQSVSPDAKMSEYSIPFDVMASFLTQSPIAEEQGPVSANIFMCRFEEKWIINSPRFHPTFWYRYVDEIMPQNTTLTQELSLATMIFEISVLELVKIAMLPKIKEKCPWVSNFGLLYI